MYTNQYIVTHKTPKKTSKYSNFESYIFDELEIYANSKLNVSICINEITQIALIGQIINPLNPLETDKEVIQRLTDTCQTSGQLLNQIQNTTGRYVLLYKTANDFIITGDACHRRRIYFGFNEGSIVITSSPKLFLDFFDYTLKISDEKREVLALDLYKDKDSSWYGNESIDDRLHKLLPNHYLDVINEKTIRIPIQYMNFSNDEEVIEYVTLLLKGTFQALASRYKLIQPLTAGWDSRILLAASKEFKDSIQYYVFKQSSTRSDDIDIPQKLSINLGFPFEIRNPKPLNEEFLSAYKNEHIEPRIIHTTANIQDHYYQTYDHDVVNVNGNCAEIARNAYGHTGRKVPLDMLISFSLYNGKIPYFDDQIAKWYEEAFDYSKENEIALLDLFYWEERMGNWGALYPFEQDMTLEEVSPFNNRSLLLALLTVDSQKRNYPYFPFYRKLVLHLWADVLSEPINPGAKYIRKIIDGQANMRQIIYRIARVLPVKFP